MPMLWFAIFQSRMGNFLNLLNCLKKLGLNIIRKAVHLVNYVLAFFYQQLLTHFWLSLQFIFQKLEKIFCLLRSQKIFPLNNYSTIEMGNNRKEQGLGNMVNEIKHPSLAPFICPGSVKMCEVGHCCGRRQCHSDLPIPGNFFFALSSLGSQIPRNTLLY